LTDSSRPIDWRPHTPDAAPDRRLRDDPGRILLLAAAVAIFLGGLMPWAQGTDPGGRPIAYTPQQALAEGYIMIVLALVLAVLAAGRWLVESSTRTVQLSPLAIAVVGGAMWLGADRTSNLYITDWTNGGGSGEQTIWRLITLGAIVAIVVATIWLEFTRPRDIRAETRSLLSEWTPSRVSVVEALAAGTLGITLAVIGGAATIIAIGPNGAIFAVFISLLAMAAGISAGLGLVRWFRGGGDGTSSDPANQRRKIALSRVSRRRS